MARLPTPTHDFRFFCDDPIADARWRLRTAFRLLNAARARKAAYMVDLSRRELATANRYMAAARAEVAHRAALVSA